MNDTTRQLRKQSSQSTSIFALPSPVFAEIIQNLDLDTLRAFRLVNRQVKNIIDENIRAITVTETSNRAQHDAALHLLSPLVWSRWPSLRKLDLRMCRIRDDGAWALAATAWECLDDVNLQGCDLGPACGPALSTLSPTLVRLNLQGNINFGSRGLLALASVHWPCLQTFSMAKCLLEEGEGGALATALSRMPGLQVLDVSNNVLKGQGIKSLLSVHLPHLVEVDLSGNRLGGGVGGGAHGPGGGGGGCPLACAATAWPSLMSLKLDGNRIGIEGALALANCSPSWSRLRALSVCDCHLDPESVAALLHGQWEALDTLSLSNNDIGIQGINALVAPHPTSISGHPPLPRLSHLDLSDNGLQDEELQTLFRAHHFMNKIETLKLRNASMGQLSARAVGGALAAHALSTLRSLSLAGAKLEHVVIESLFAKHTWPALETLILTGCGLGEGGVGALTSSARRCLPRVLRLDVKDCGIANTGNTHGLLRVLLLNRTSNSGGSEMTSGWCALRRVEVVRGYASLPCVIGNAWRLERNGGMCGEAAYVWAPTS